MSGAAAKSPTADAAPKPPVVIVLDNHDEASSASSDVPKKKRAKTASGSNGSSKSKPPPMIKVVFHPDSNTLLDSMLHPLSKADFLQHHFRQDAVHIRRKAMSAPQREAMVSDICNNYLFDADVRQIFAETSSENVFLWLRPPPSAAATATATTDSTSSASSSSSPPAAAAALNSVEISDPETAYALHESGSHPAYCRAPPALEQHLVGSLLRATGLGGGHYHPPRADAVTLGGAGTTLGRGEVELFIGAANAGNNDHAASAASSTSTRNGKNGSANDDDQASGGKKHTTGWHTDFQENFTIQLSGVKRWTLRRGRVRHPLRGTTPHYARDASVVENQLKLARLSCLGGNAVSGLLESTTGAYGFEYDDNNAYGEEQTVTLHPGDVFYFPSGMWHRVETVEPGISLNVSLMGTTYATLVSEALEHLMVGSDEGWREVVTSRPGAEDGTNNRLQGLLGGLSKLVDDFVNKQGGAQSLLPPALCHPQLGLEEDGPAEDHGRRSDDERSESMDENAEGEGSDVEVDDDDDEDIPPSGIIVRMEDFKGPPGWSCTKPPNAKLVRNPLASLIGMPDITGEQDLQAINGTVVKEYVLNMNFAGNEMMESHIRVMLESLHPDLIIQMDWFLQCEASGKDLAHMMNHPCELTGEEKGICEMPPPLCLFYYGYFSWNVNS